jgi:hypothetical protein
VQYCPTTLGIFPITDRIARKEIAVQYCWTTLGIFPITDWIARKEIAVKYCRTTLGIFPITDRNARKEIAVQYCPTKEMIGDYFTKPLQGGLFYKFRDKILGLVPMGTIIGDHRSVLDYDLKAAPQGTGTKTDVSQSSFKPRKRARSKVNGQAKGPQSHITWGVFNTPFLEKINSCYFLENCNYRARPL